ncbi:branched-chain amino acid ABC transporter permease [Vallicoccus soli]|uniref:Branched-chain amino acid ABC transporter permease n=1 Tax=Vallicoccus soli TaxID=2339232 RepID=A0A3A3YVH0_9ACTN|nr:branched-chain amino acid ABC transporter permease [Vallicoccus soli]
MGAATAGTAAALSTPAPTPAATAEVAPGATPGAGDPAAPGTGAPAEPEGETVQGRLEFEDAPQEGVVVTVEGGGFSGEATTDAEGAWVVDVPGPGSYTVTLDEESLAEGVSLRNPDRNPITTQVNGGQNKTVLFALGEGSRQVASDADRALQLAAEGLRFGLLIALAAVGLSLIFGTTGLTNFAHGELVTLGALVAFLFHGTLGVPLWLATLLTIVVCGLLGGVVDRGLWAPLRSRGTGLIAMMIVSIGLSLFVRYLYLYLFGGTTRSYPDAQGQEAVDLGPITLSPLDYLSMLIAVVVLVAVGFALLRTRIGKATRAVADNPALASASGIDVEGVIRTVWIVGAALAGLAGVLLGIAQQVNWQMGFQILLLIFAAVTLGGLGTAFGALVGSLVVGIFVQVSTLVIPAELKNVAALAVLIVILLVRPQGILGRRERVG